MEGIIVLDRSPEALELLTYPMVKGKNYLNPLELAAILYESAVDPTLEDAVMILQGFGLTILDHDEPVILKALFLIAAYDSTMPDHLHSLGGKF